MPAWRAISSKLAAAPSRVKTSLATSRMRSRLRWASARGLRAGEGVGGFFFGTGEAAARKFLQTETLSVYTNIRRQSPYYSAAARLSIRARSPRAAAQQTEDGDACIRDGRDGFHWN